MVRHDSKTDTKVVTADTAMMQRRQPLYRLSDSAEEEDQYVFTSLRFDPKAKTCKTSPDACKETKAIYLFKYHFDRLKDAAGHRGWYDAQKAAALKKPGLLYERIANAVANHQKETGNKGPFKVGLLDNILFGSRGLT